MERNYKQIFSWENKERIKYLENFKANVINYFSGIEHDDFGDSLENEIAKKERKEINKHIDKAHSYIITTGISTKVINYPALKTGWKSHHIDLVLNIFNLIEIDVGHRPLLDIIERAIAIYKKDSRRAKQRTYCPLFWIALLIDCLVSLPFEALGKAGFNQNRIEVSFMGKFFKYVFYIISYLFLAVLAHIFISSLIKAGYLTNP